MGRTNQVSPRERLKMPVYLLVVLAYLAVVLPWSTLQCNWKSKNQLAQSVTITEIEQAQKTTQAILLAAEAKKYFYGPEDYFRDAAEVVPIRSKFETIQDLRDDFSQTAAMAKNTVEDLLIMARYNWPTDSDANGYDAWLSNRAKWDKAQLEAKRPVGFEPITISGEDMQNFLYWILNLHIKFLPFGFVLIIINNWQRQISSIKELSLRPLFVIACFISGPIGILIHSAADISGRQPEYALKRALYMRQQKKWMLTEEEEWKIQNDTEGQIFHKTKIALALSYFILVITTVSNTTEGRWQKMLPSCSETSISQAQSNTKNDQARLILGSAEASLNNFLNAPHQQQLVARVKDIEQIDPLVSKTWFLPPSLAPPLTRR